MSIKLTLRLTMGAFHCLKKGNSVYYLSEIWGYGCPRVLQTLHVLLNMDVKPQEEVDDND